MNYKKDSIFNTLGNFAYLGVLWVISVLAVRMGSFETAGYFALALTTSNIYIAIASYTVRLYYAADVQAKYSDRQYFIMRLITTAISFILCIVVSSIIGYQKYSLQVIIIFYVFKIFEMLSDIIYGAMQRHGKLYVAGYSMIIKSVAVLAVFVVLMLIFKELLIAIIGMCIIAAGSFAFMDLGYSRRIGVKLLPWKAADYRAAFKLMWVCIPLLLVGICYNLIPVIPRLSFEKMYSTAEYGIFSSLSTVTVLISTAINCVTVPFISRLSTYYQENKIKNFVKILLGLCGLTIGLGAVALLLSFLVGKPVLILLFGAEIGGYMNVFNQVIVATVFTSLVICLNAVLTAADKQKWILLGNIPGITVCLLFSNIFCKMYYMSGVSYILILSQGINTLVLGIIIILVLKKQYRRNQAGN